MPAVDTARWWWSCHQDNPRSGGRGRFSYGGYNLALPLHVAARTVGCVDNRSEIRDFLATRRAKLTPDQVGLPTSGRRRVPGLRREEVAVLAGVSTDWYIRLEKGHISGVSDDVLDAVARALRLGDAPGRPSHQPARPGPVRTRLRRPSDAGEHGPLLPPRPGFT